MKKRTRTLVRIGLIIVLVVSAVFLYRSLRSNGGGTSVALQSSGSSSSSGVNNSSTQPAGLDKTKYSTDTPGSLWWVVNKNRPLPEGYVPPDLIVPAVKLRLAASAEQMHMGSEAGHALEKMFAAGNTTGLQLMLDSGYRSAAYQAQLYNSYVAKDGQEAADKYSARPGTSEHQTGMAVDVGRADGNCELEICFADTAEGKWITEHAHEYGFIVRYPDGKESVTTYQYEPWHLRYVGVELATELHKTGQTMEEFFGL